MHASSLASRWGFAVVVGILALPAGASELLVNPAQMSLVGGTAAVRVDAVAGDVVVLPRPSSVHNRSWQVASVDAALLANQASLITFKPVAFESPSVGRLGAEAAVLDRPVASGSAASKSREPGFWATALSTLALALFFFLRRLT